MFAPSSLALALALFVAPSPSGPPDLKRDGAFAFPQSQATVLCDTDQLRVSAFSDAEHLYVQAILWTDGDDRIGETDDGRDIGDWSNIAIDVDADGKATAETDREYSLNPWPSAPGLHYQVMLSESSSSGLKSDSKGRGAVSYVEAPDGARVRIDSFLIPLAELGRQPGDKIRLAYWGDSPHPRLTVNSVDFVPTDPARKYYTYSLPRDSWHTLVLADRPATIDDQQVPEGRQVIGAGGKAPREAPGIGTQPPEITAESWINSPTETPPTLANLKGKVVIVEFWATWCGPCVQSIPHLNKLHDEHTSQGLVILSLTDQKLEAVEKFMPKSPMKYRVGVKSRSLEDYGVTGIPHAFVIGRDGKLRWHGHPQQDEFDKHIADALKD